MGILEHEASSARHTMRAETLIGRSRSSDIQLGERAISGRHALLRWVDERWEIRDLGSRNGTWVNGRRLEPGERVILEEGAEIALGEPGDTWRLLAADPPVPAARSVDSDEAAIARGGLLSLPSGESPEISIYRDPAGDWVAERDGGIEPVEDGAIVQAAGARWRLFLPGAVERTWELSQAPTVSTIELAFAVSRDEEYTRLEIVHGGARIPLEDRVHHYLLLTLARERRADAERDPDEPQSHGWVHQEDLARMLRIAEGQVNLQIFRARRQFASAGVEDAAGLIERRSPSRMLRLGVGRVQIETI